MDSGAAETTDSSAPWAFVADRAPSEVAHHGRACCDVALSWLRAMDASYSGGASGGLAPAWMAYHWRWGASPWPLHWCELATRERIDCGALAALARMLILSSGSTALGMQLLERYPSDTTAHWRSCWARDGIEASWVSGDIVYHEAVAIIDPAGAARVWDPTDTAWLRFAKPSAYGGIVAFRVSAGDTSVARFRWQGIDAPIGEWTVIDAEEAGHLTLDLR